MEKIPQGQRPIEIDAKELLVTVFHFHQTVGQVHGIPFLIKLRIDGVFIEDVHEEIKNITKVNDREFERWKFALVQIGSSQPRYSALENFD